VFAFNALGDSAAGAAAPLTMPVWVAATGVTITESPVALSSGTFPNYYYQGTPVTFTGTGSGSTVAYQYRFWLNNGTSNTLVQDYSTLNTWTMPATTPAGNTYTLTVDVRTTPTAATPEASSTFTFALISPPATGVVLTPSVPSPHTNGTAITFTASAVGSTGYQYRFKRDGTMVQDYSATNTWTMPLSTPAGTYAITVDVRTNTASATPDATSAPLSYVLFDGHDFNSDGKPDILWQNQANGMLAAWLMNGTSATSIVSLSPSAVSDTNWKIVGIGDFNNDGKPDLIWQDQVTGDIAAWLMNGTSATSIVMLNPSRISDTNWKIVGVGDFNSDGKSDLIWQDQVTGDIAAWLMNGTSATSIVSLSPSTVSDTNWKIVGVVDFNGDGKPDLIWQDQVTGDIAAWLMNGTSATSIVMLNPSQISDITWKIVGR
jgi:hypothetical protein